MSSDEEEIPQQQQPSRRLPNRSKSAAVKSSSAASTTRNKVLPKRTKSSADGTSPRRQRQGRDLRSKKKGIRVAIMVRKDDTKEQQQESLTSTSNTSNKEELLQIYNMQVNCRGKFSRKGNWPDVERFWNGNTTDTKTVDRDTMCDLLDQYSHQQYPNRRGAENTRPKRCYLRDEPLRGISYYKDYDWNPVKLNLKAETNVEILERWTQSVTLESIHVDFSTDLETVLKEQGDKTVVSTLTKSKLQGHSLALSIMTSDTQIVVELRGLESVVGVLGNDETPDDTNDDNGDSIWRDVKTLRALLHDKPMPQREGKGQQRTVEVVALESYLKFRIYYSAFFEGDMVSDHGVGLLLGERWWAHPLKDIMMGFDVENSAKIYEDITLHFYSEIGYKMENEYFDWENQGGKWVKVKKFRNQQQ